MKYLNLDPNKVENIVRELDILLADYNMYYQKLRNFHWNVVGPHFFELHEKFEEMYDDAKVKVDEIAERILTLRYQPTSNFSSYLEMSNLTESPEKLTDMEMVKTLLEDHGKLIEQLTRVLHTADEAGDTGTEDLLGAYVGDLEKTSWMLDAWTMKASETHKVMA